ncbi:MAG: glycosyltransferase family 2 protein [Candidatus Paceibacterota bacterium]|jgi:glycosyltransferase involved in cell wall biosynthesis
MKTTITIAIPSYNKEKYIKKCLSSILNEKHYIDKIILLDNCSTDKTFEIAKTFEPEIKCIQNDTNLGMVGNWNKCIELCETDWLMIFHADDEMVPDVVSHYRETIQKYPTANLVCANAYSIIEEDESTKSLGKSDPKEFYRAGLEAMGCRGSVCSAVMVKKEAYNKLGYFIDSLSSDVEMWHRISSKYDVAFLNMPTVIYRINASSTGPASLINRDVREIKADWDLLTEKMAGNYPSKESRDAFIKKCIKDAPEAYLTVIKANIRARNYRKVLDALFLIIFTYRGFVPLVSLSSTIIKKQISKLFKQS